MSPLRMLLWAAFLFLAFAAPSHAEDGYDLWLRYRPIEAGARQMYRTQITQIVAPATSSPTLEAAQRELERGLSGLLAHAIPVSAQPTRSGALL